MLEESNVKSNLKHSLLHPSDWKEIYQEFHSGQQFSPYDKIFEIKIQMA